MCRCLIVAIALALTTLAGCASDRDRPATARLHAPPPAGPVGEDVVFLDVAIIERAPGDEFLNHDLWLEADEQAIRGEDGEQAVSLERKTVLEKNGFRAGQVGGLLPPAKLQDLLLSKRYCDAHRIQLHAGKETIVSLGPLQPHCRCRVIHDEQTETVDLHNAQCQLTITPTLAEDDRLHLLFTPHIKHGETKTVYTSQRDAAGMLRWGRQEQQPDEVYPWMSWTLIVTANEYVVIGAILENGDRLGERFFLSTSEQGSVQRLLVIRAAHVPTEAARGDEKMSRSPPLALRANAEPQP